MKKPWLYYHTLKYLRYQQLYYRLYYFFYKPRPALSIVNSNKRNNALPAQSFIVKNKLSIQKNHATFLNKTQNISDAKIWNDFSCGKLWLYNLHYFDALQTDAHQQKTAYALLERWIIENPPFDGVGWEPFPTSLRIINIVKYALSGNALSDAVQESLYLQARYLNKKCEYHLLGNHLFENFKALCLAGLFFDTPESKKWFDKGYRGLTKEIREQVLPDGGHFELSPMYHCLFLEGLLDLALIFNAYQQPFLWRSSTQKMLNWLNGMKRFDREISYFNDAANDIAEKPDVLFAYAKQLGYEIPAESTGLCYFSDSGYLVVKKNTFKIIIDVGDIGPDYLPGHGHADVLSFEWIVNDMPVFVNLGTSRYGYSPRRIFERGTSAHNTVVVNHCDSSDVWGDFRVGKRARVTQVVLTEHQGIDDIQATHNGYCRFEKKIFHSRQWEISENEVIITDYLRGDAMQAIAYFHLHPDCEIVSETKNKITIQLRNHQIVQFETNHENSVIDNDYAESFGVLRKTKTIKLTINQNNPRSRARFFIR